MMWCKCKICGEEISPEYPYTLKDGQVFCSSHDQQSCYSQAGEPHTGDGCLRPADTEQENGE